MQKTIKQCLCNLINDASQQINSLSETILKEYMILLDKNLVIKKVSKNCVDFSKNSLYKEIVIGDSVFQWLFSESGREIEAYFTRFLAANLNLFPFMFDHYVNEIFLQTKIQCDFKAGMHVGYSMSLFILSTQTDHIELERRLQRLDQTAQAISESIKNWHSTFKTGPFGKGRKFSHFGESIVELDLELKLNQSISKLKYLIQANKEPQSVLIPNMTELKIANIVLIDDEIVYHRFAHSLFEQLKKDIRLFSFTEASEAFQFIKTYPTDLILLDMSMPSYSGWEFVENIRQLKRDIPVVIVTAHLSTDVIARALQFSQIKGLITKPLRREYLSRMIVSNFK